MPITTLPFIQLFAVQQARTLRERLCATLRELMHSGALKQDERLPSSRLLASDLSLSRVTVEAAYAQLESEGWLLRKTGKGTFVAFTAPPVRQVKKSVRAAPFELSARGRHIVAKGGCDDPLFPLAFAAGSPDLRAFPHLLWRRLVGQHLRDDPLATMRYGSPQGLPALREAVAGYLAQARGVRCRAEQVMILTSSQQALQMLALLLCDPGDRVWLEEPGYGAAYQAFRSAGAEVSGIVLDDCGAVVPSEGTAKLVYLTPSHQYPTGVAMSLARRLQWLAFAKRENSWLIEDDYDSEFYYDGQPMPALQGLDKASRVLYSGTFSKVLFPSLRLAYLVLPEALIEPFCRLRSVMDGHSAQLMQAVTADFIQQGHFQAHLRLMRKLYASRRDLLVRELTEKMGDRLRLLGQSGGLQLAAVLANGDEAALTRQALQAGLLLPRLSPLFLGAPQYQGWLLGFSALSGTEIVQAVEKLARLIERGQSPA